MNQEKIDTSVTGSKAVMEMITVANEFCLFAEEQERFDNEFIFSYLQRILPLLYIKGSLLPQVTEFPEHDNERFVIEETWEYLYNSFKNNFKHLNNYYFWDPELQGPAETTMSENLADLYQDLKDFIFLFSKPSHYAKQNAVFMCRELFIHRWGKIIPHLLSHIHGIIVDTKQHSDEDEL